MELFNQNGMQRIELDCSNFICFGQVPRMLEADKVKFNSLWALHPEEYHQITIHGNSVLTPRWQQAYGRDYFFTGQTNYALAIPELLKPYLEWAQSSIDKRLNGLLLNWYDGSLGHYIGRHRDSTKNLLSGCPIVTVSLGEARIFRLRPWGKEKIVGTKAKYCDLNVVDGSVIVLPYNANLHWTHEVPKLARFKGRRISITMRAFSV